MARKKQTVKDSSKEYTNEDLEEELESEEDEALGIAEEEGESEQEREVIDEDQPQPTFEQHEIPAEPSVRENVKHKPGCTYEEYPHVCNCGAL